MYEDIVTKKERYPKFLSNEAISLLKLMLVKDPKRRIGARRGLEEIKEHEFCKGINWDNIYNK